MSKSKSSHSTAHETLEIIPAGGELHQLAGGSHPSMTDNQGAVVADDENSLKLGERGPVLLEDFTLRQAGPSHVE